MREGDVALAVLPQIDERAKPDMRKTMSDLTKYVRARAARDPEFADGLESGYTDFKVGALLRQALEKARLT